MAKRILTQSEQLKELTNTLTSDYARWKDIYENGCTDPGYSDGTNIDLKRNHIIHGKQRLEELLKDQFWLYPDVYYLPTPPPLPWNYMAKDRSYYGSHNNTDTYEKDGKVFHRANRTMTYADVMQFGVKYVEVSFVR